MAKERENSTQIKHQEIDGFIILNSEKLNRVFSELGEDAKEKDVLAAYDKLGGGIRTKDGRKVATGTFWDFENKCPKNKVVVSEENFEDKFVLVRKEKRVKKEKDEDLKARIARMESVSKREPKIKDEE